jgi:hypothetical protein
MEQIFRTWKLAYTAQKRVVLKSIIIFSVISTVRKHCHCFINNIHYVPITQAGTDWRTDRHNINNWTYLFPSRPPSHYCYHIFHSTSLKEKKQGSVTILSFKRGPNRLQHSKCCCWIHILIPCGFLNNYLKSKEVPQHSYGGEGDRGCIAPTHSRPRH